MMMMMIRKRMRQNCENDDIYGEKDGDYDVDSNKQMEDKDNKGNDDDKCIGDKNSLISSYNEWGGSYETVRMVSITASFVASVTVVT